MRKDAPKDARKTMPRSGPKSGAKTAGRFGSGSGPKSGPARSAKPGAKSASYSTPKGDKSQPSGQRSGQQAGQRPPLRWKPGQNKPGPKSTGTGETRAEAASAGAPIGQMRIAKAMARAGLCSRREAERWIAEGRVSVNGKLLATPAFEVGPSDRVVVDGEPLPVAEPVRLWRYHKPRGLVTTHKDPEGRPTVFDNLPETMPRVISIGRLDFNTEGLLLLTTDGALARHLELPSTGWLRRYRVRARGRITQARLDELKNGVTIEDVSYGPIEATLDSEHGANIWLTVGLREGKNREIRKIMAHLMLDVGRLIRVSFGPFQLLDLEQGTVEPVKRRVLAEQLGARLARELGVVVGTEAEDKPRPGAHTGHPPKPRRDDRRKPSTATDDSEDWES